MFLQGATDRRAVLRAVSIKQSSGIRFSGSGRARAFSVCVLLALALAAPAAAQVAPDLGTAASYAILGTNTVPTIGTVSCTDTGPGTVIDGDVGTTFNGGITNTLCTITGTIDSPVAASVVTDFNAAFDAANDANPCTGTIPITTTTLAPGVYCSAAGTTIGAGVILTLDGDASDTWVFRVGTGGLGALTLTNAQVVMAGAADACNVFWTTAQAATLTNSDFVGTILSGAAITMNSGSWFGRALATTDVTITDAAPLTFAGCAAPAAITVSKDFSDNNPAPVSVSISCTSGVLDATTLNAAEGAPAVFTVSTADISGTTCTATESVPVGYTADQADCVGVPLAGSCTIVNTLIVAPNTITVIKDFSDNSLASVAVDLICTSGMVTTTPLNATEAAPAIFEVTGATLGATCTATESVPLGYTANQTNCVGVALDGACTIVNTLIVAPNTITVIKDFIPDSFATVSVTLTCPSGTVTATPLDASEAQPAVFTVTAAAPGTICTATEAVPAGYVATQTDCLSVALGGSCTIINTLNQQASVPIPSGSVWGMFLLVGSLILLGFAAIRERAA